MCACACVSMCVHIYISLIKPCVREAQQRESGLNLFRFYLEGVGGLWNSIGSTYPLRHCSILMWSVECFPVSSVHSLNTDHRCLVNHAPCPFFKKGQGYSTEGWKVLHITLSLLEYVWQ